jgi:hypothetical protein
MPRFDEDFEGETERLPTFYSVAVYLIDCAYGGPEEGGWYYDTYTRSTSFGQHLRGFPTSLEARVYAQLLNDTVLKEENEDRRPISSVLSEGQYIAIVCDEWPESHYPTERPHYE